MLGEAAGLVLAEDQVAVEADIEDPAGALDQFGFYPVFALDCLRQTGGLGQVVSLLTVLDRNVHRSPPGPAGTCVL